MNNATIPQAQPAPVDRKPNSKDACKSKCIRYHKNGEKDVEHREQDVVELWVRFNKDFRPDAALFVDGECRRQGAHSKVECDAISAGLRVSVVRSEQVALDLSEDLANTQP